MYDAVIVGAGASGGWAAKRLTEAGLRVALVDAGRPHTNADAREHIPLFNLRYRGLAPEFVRRTRPRQVECYACTEHNYDWFVNDLEEPYTTPADKPFSWQGRVRLTGGRTNVWARQCYRFSDLDFKAASFDGFGQDWPLAYDDIAPYYDLVEQYVGISGQAENVAELPDGRFLPPMALTCAESRLRDRVRSLGRTVTIGRCATLTAPHRGRAACHYCGPCERGCMTRSYFNAAFTTVADAVATGRCTHVPNAMVHRVLHDPTLNHATGVVYLDRVTRERHEVSGRVVILCAQALESVRILLNSATRERDTGLANSSGVLGHYLQDHVWNGGGARGEFADWPGMPALSGPHRPNGFYVIRFRNIRSGPRYPKFLRGYGMQGGWADGAGFNWGAPGFGPAFKESLRRGVVTMNVGGFGECLARFENYVEIDPGGTTDAYGIPVLRIHMQWSDNERAMIPDMAEAAAEMLDAAGARQIQPWTVPDRTPGMSIHECGVARMGSDPKTSVLNQFQQAHDIPNLFVMDASGFPSCACQNPTLTIMALAVRSCDYMLEEMRKGNF